MSSIPSIRPDLIAYDAQKRPVLLVEINAARPWASADVHELVAALGSETEFVMLADLRTIQLFRVPLNGRGDQPILVIPTAEVLSHYDPDFSNKTIYQDYLAVLVEAWLRDIEYHWKSTSPPVIDKLQALGLSQRLQDGSTQLALSEEERNDAGAR